MPKCPFALPLIVIGLACALTAQTTRPGVEQFPSNPSQLLLVNRVAPIYPPLAREARIQGIVILDAIISTTGDVIGIELVSGHPMLAPAAIDAVKQWKYRPHLLDGQPVQVETLVYVNFMLKP